MYDAATHGPIVRSEVIDNPAHYGDPAATATVMSRLNTPEEARTVEQVNAGYFSGNDLAACGAVDPAEYDAAVEQVPANKTFIENLVALGQDNIAMTHRPQISAIYSRSPNITAAIDAKWTRNKTQIEVITGTLFDSITQVQWADARGPGTPGRTMNTVEQEAHAQKLTRQRVAEREAAGNPMDQDEIDYTYQRALASAATKEAPGETRSFS